METVHFKRKQDDGKLFILICDIATIWSNINNSHKSLRHTHTHIQGSLLKWNTQSLTFMGVRRYSFDRARIPKEWNHHQCGCHIMDLLLGLLADWQEGSLEEVLTWPNVHISVSVLLCQKEKRRRDKETAAAVGGVKGSWCSSGASKQNRDMTQIPSCNGDRGSERSEGSLDAPSGHMKKPLQSTVAN